MGAKNKSRGSSEAKAQKHVKPENIKQQTTDAGQPRTPNLMFFLFLGLVVICVFSSLHVLFSGVISFILGIDFLTVIYVTAAAVTTGAVITMALALLVSLYCILTFFTGLHNTASTATQQRQDPSRVSPSLEELISTAVAPKSSSTGVKME